MIFNCSNGNFLNFIIGASIGSYTLTNNVNPVAFLPYGNNFLYLDSTSTLTEFNGTNLIGQSCNEFI